LLPLQGVYANLIAQLISQISSHFIIHYHRRIEERASQEYDRRHGLQRCSTAVLSEENEGDVSVVQQDVVSSSLLSDSPKERLYQHTFSRPHRGESDKLTTRRGVNAMLIATSFTLSVLVLVGCFIPSFSLEVLGMVGIMVESGQGFNDAAVEHSVFTVINLLFEQAAFTGRTADYIGLGTLSVVLISTVLLVPIALAAVLLYMWMRPLSTRRRYRCEVLLEALQAWQYADVFLVSVIVASWQLGPVSTFMVNAYCGSLDETFAQLVHYGIMKEEDAQCFQVTSKVEDGSFVLATGAVLLALLNTFIMRAVVQYFRDKENEARRGQDLAKLEALSDDIGALSPEEVTQAKSGISPVPVLFTDTFRWCLMRHDAAISMRSSSSSDESSANRDRPQDDYDAAERPFSSYQYSPDDNDDENDNFVAGMTLPAHMEVASLNSFSDDDEGDSGTFVSEIVDNDDDDPNRRKRPLSSFNSNGHDSSCDEDIALGAATSVVELLRKAKGDQQLPDRRAVGGEKYFR
jgi:Paraquat-inducible protein A